MKSVYETKYLKIEVDSSQDLMVQSWLRFCTTEEFKDGQLKTVKYFKENKCKNFISDATNAGVRQKEDTDWAAREIIPALAKEGMRALNFVVPQSYFAKIAIQNLDAEHKANVQSGAEIKFYPSMEEAMKNLS